MLNGPYLEQVQELYEQRFIPWFSLPAFMWFTGLIMLYAWASGV